MIYKTILAFVSAGLILAVPTISFASECTPGKSFRNSYTSVRGGSFKLDASSYKKLIAERPTNIAAAKSLPDTSSLSPMEQRIILDKGARSAKAEEDYPTYLALMERLISMDTNPMPSYTQKDMADAYVETGDYKKAHALYALWFPSAGYVFEKDHNNMTLAAEGAGDIDAAWFHAKCELRTTRLNVKRNGELRLDILRFSAASQPRSVVEADVNDFLTFLSKRVSETPLSRSKYLDLGANILRKSEFTDLAVKLDNEQKKIDLSRLKTMSYMYGEKCKEGSAEDCLNQAHLYKNESLYKDYRFHAFQAACSNGSQRGCYEEGIFHLYGIVTSKDQGLAQTLFETACGNKIGDACHAAAIKYTDISKPSDINQARTLYEKGCTFKSGRSCFSLGNSFRNPRDGHTTPDLKLAKKYYKKACKFGEGLACMYAKNMR